MFRLDNILERWAQDYQPLSHDPRRGSKHRTFFRISVIDGNSEFVRNLSTTPSPAMAYATHPDGEIAQHNANANSYRHVIYFMVKPETGTLSKNLATDDLAATDARFMCNDLVEELLAYLGVLKRMAGGKLPQTDMADIYNRNFALIPAEDREGLRGLQLDAANWSTLPLPNGTLNGWQICGLTLEQITPRHLCTTPSKYK